ncbi:hypothetical protein PFISCL1PPCAC_9959, partial [Pristionchus fissidentatus]
FSTKQHRRAVAYPSSFISFKYIFPLADESEDVLGSLQSLCLTQGNLEGEFILDRHHDLHVIQRIEAQFSENGIQLKEAGLVGGEAIPCTYRLEHTLFHLLESELLGSVEGTEDLDTAQSCLYFEDGNCCESWKIDGRSDR